MHITVVGLNHHTAPIEVRERLTFSAASLANALEGLLSVTSANECVILSTCNRTEIYAAAQGVTDIDRQIRFLADYHAVPQSDFESLLYRHVDEAAVSHLFRVAGGLDSLVLGEPQILGQVRDAFSAADGVGATGLLLNALFRAAVVTGRRARSETDIGKGGFSIGHAAVDLARSIFGSLDHAGILILGAGKMSELTVRHLVRAGARIVVVANRTYDRAESMAEKLGGAAIRYDEFPEALAKADIVISSTASPHHIINRAELQPVMRRRRGRPLFLVDIAVPRDISPDVAHLQNVFLYDLDDLEEVVTDMARERAGEARLVEAIVQDETGRFMAWWRSLAAVPLVTRLRDKHETIRQEELARLRNQLGGLPESAWEKIESATRSMMNRISRDPIARLKEAAHTAEADADSKSGPPLLRAAEVIFGLETEPRELVAEDPPSTNCNARDNDPEPVQAPGLATLSATRTEGQR